jgi:hypothetical protein
LNGKKRIRNKKEQNDKDKGTNIINGEDKENMAKPK